MSLSKQLMVGVAAGLMAVAGVYAQKDATVRFDASAVTFDEIAALEQRVGDYSLKLVLAAKGSGDYLADVDVQIVSLPQRELVLHERTQGPLLMAALPPGRYEITGTFGDVALGTPESVKRTVVVPRSGQAHAVMHFGAGA
jgi:hypothetical protein